MEMTQAASAFAATLTRIGAQLPALIGRALREEAEIEMAEMKQRTPVDTGALRASGMVVGPTAVGSGVQIAWQYGGPSAPYALIVHENLEAIHPVGQAKYLESVLDESVPYLENRIGSRLKALIAAAAQ